MTKQHVWNLSPTVKLACNFHFLH